MAIPRTVLDVRPYGHKAGEQVGMLSDASMKRKRAQNLQREIKMWEECDIVGSMCARKK